jgi:3-oxoadipate enol-lactonase
MRFERANGIVQHLSVTGPENQPWIVFANSLGTDFRIWDGVLDALDDRYRVLRYDMRGHGLTEAPPGPYAMTDLRDDLLCLFNQLEIERATIVGLSVGGMVAQSLAAAAPDRVDRLVLMDTAHRIGPPALWEDRIAAVSDGGMEAIADAVLERWFSSDYKTVNPQARAGARAMLSRVPAVGYAGICAAIRDADLTEAAARIDVPTLCLCGDQDKATPPDLVLALADLLPRAEFRLIEGAGHLPCLEKPDAVATEITAFLTR